MRSALVEKRPGVFTLKSRAFLHFHDDPSGVFADVRLADAFVRMPVTSSSEQSDLLDRIDDCLSTVESRDDDRRRRRERRRRRGALCLAAIAVSSSTASVVLADESAKIDLASATALVRSAIFEAPRPDLELELREVVDAELWSDLGAQLFAKTQKSFALVRSHFVIERGVVHGVGSMGPPFRWCLADLDGDGARDFVYSAVYGSGWARSRVDALMASSDGLFLLPGSWTLQDREIVLSCESDGTESDDTVWVATAKPSAAQRGEAPAAPVRFGRLVVEGSGDRRRLRIEMDRSAPAGILQDVWDVSE